MASKKLLQLRIVYHGRQIELKSKYQNLYEKVPTATVPEPNEDMQVFKAYKQEEMQNIRMYCL